MSCVCGLRRCSLVAVYQRVVLEEDRHAHACAAARAVWWNTYPSIFFFKLVFGSV